MKTIESVFQEIGSLRASDFMKVKEVPRSLRESISWLAECYTSGNQQTRNEIRSMVKFESSFVFFMYAGLMAVEAVREHSSSALLNGLTALSIENLTFDSRESYFPLVCLFHSTKKLGLNPEELIARISRISSEPMSKFLSDFLQRTPEEQQLSVFKIKESHNSKGEFCYASDTP